MLNCSAQMSLRSSWVVHLVDFRLLKLMVDENRIKNLTNAQFTVDAALLRELGERLIGRAHIALAELVKNSYDADAHTCRIDVEADRIVVSDDGHGISQEEFINYWMRIGTTHKVESRRSRDLGRSMTGSKGLGRLSVQFLAREMELESNCKTDPNRMLYAYVDWRSIRRRRGFADGGREVEDQTRDSGLCRRFADRDAHNVDGVTHRLGRRCDRKFGQCDVWMLRSPFHGTKEQTRGKTALDFYVDLNAPQIESAKDHFDKLHNALFENWKARITGVLEDGRRGDGSKATVTVEFAKNYPEGVEEAGTFRETVNFPIPRKTGKTGGRDKSVDGGNGVSEGGGDEKDTNAAERSALDKARYVILVFKTEGRQPSGLSVGEMRDYLRKYGDVSVYDAGFRLPYYGSQDLDGHDWLNVGVDQGRRLISSELLPKRLRIPGRYLLDLPNPGRIFGAVDVDTNYERRVAVQRTDGGDRLQIQPGRDRLASNESFEQLRRLVRFGLDFYANRYRAVADDVAQKQHGKQPPGKVLGRALSTLERYKGEIPPTAYRDIRRGVAAVRKAVETESKAVDSRAALLGPLATAGMAALAMNHELANDSALLEDLADLLQGLVESDPSPKAKQALSSLDDYRSRFDAYRILFSPLADPEERKVTRRLPVESVVSQVVRALRARLSGVVFDSQGVAGDLLFPQGAFAEWSAVLQNLLFNAWNAMLEADRRVVRFDGSEPNARRQYLRVSDTGAGLAVPVEEADILFEAFERRASIRPADRSIAVGGQGLGLAIVRTIARSRRTEVAFVKPPRGFSTAIELSWKG